MIKDVIPQIERLRGTRSMNRKKEIIRKWRYRPALMTILEYVYDPFKVFHIKKTPKLSASGDYHINTRFIKNTFDPLINRTYTGKKALSYWKERGELLYPEYQDLFIDITRKDLRAGMGIKTVLSVYPQLFEHFEVMLAKKFDAAHVSFPCYASAKIDGIRAIWKNGEFYSRTGHIIYGVSHLKKLLSPKIHLDGELFIPGKGFDTGSGLIRDRNEHPEAVYAIFEAPAFIGTFEQRLQWMEDLVELINNPHIRMVKHKLCHRGQEIFDYYEKARKAGYEGLVVKPRNYKYVYTRSYSWMKLKNVSVSRHQEMDLKAIGFKEGTGKYEGMLGAVLSRYKGNVISIGSGFTDDERQEIWDHRSDYMGQNLEVEYMEVSSHGRLRHPRFKRWRFDK